MPLVEKVRTIAQKLYGAADIAVEHRIEERFKELQAGGFGHFPVCIAKTQYSFSTDAAAKGAPSGHIISIREVRLSAGAEFIVVICGEIMTMPGLPKVPAASSISVNAEGRIVGLF
jgi:formate--tetrahydrofolate ligase